MQHHIVISTLLMTYEQFLQGKEKIASNVHIACICILLEQGMEQFEMKEWILEKDGVMEALS